MSEATGITKGHTVYKFKHGGAMVRIADDLCGSLTSEEEEDALLRAAEFAAAMLLSGYGKQEKNT